MILAAYGRPRSGLCTQRKLHIKALSRYRTRIFTGKTRLRPLSLLPSLRLLFDADQSAVISLDYSAALNYAARAPRQIAALHGGTYAVVADTAGMGLKHTHIYTHTHTHTHTHPVSAGQWHATARQVAACGAVVRPLSASVGTFSIKSAASLFLPKAGVMVCDSGRGSLTHASLKERRAGLLRRPARIFSGLPRALRAYGSNGSPPPKEPVVVLIQRFGVGGVAPPFPLARRMPTLCDARERLLPHILTSTC